MVGTQFILGLMIGLVVSIAAGVVFFIINLSYQRAKKRQTQKVMQMSQLASIQNPKSKTPPESSTVGFRPEEAGDNNSNESG